MSQSIIFPEESSHKELYEREEPVIFATFNKRKVTEGMKRWYDSVMPDFNDEFFGGDGTER